MLFWIFLAGDGYGRTDPPCPINRLELVVHVCACMLDCVPEMRRLEGEARLPP